MKKIIKGKLYNTETAKEIAAWSNGLGYRDFNWCEETLYRKKTGEYFIAGEGGARSKYAERHGDMWGAGEEIVPMTEDEARTWAEHRLDADDYIEIFGEPDEGEGAAKGFSNAQIEYALAEAPNYTDVDAFVSDMLTSVTFLDADDEDAEIAMKLVEPLQKLWHVACDPFSDFLSALGLRRVDCAKQFFIPLRTVEDWLGGKSEPTIYLKMMMARLCGYIE